MFVWAPIPEPLRAMGSMEFSKLLLRDAKWTGVDRHPVLGRSWGPSSHREVTLNTIPTDDPTTRLVLRHLLATLAYRAGKAVRGTPVAYGDFRLTPDSRTPREILAHMGDLMEWVLSMLRGKQRWTDATPLEWEEEVARFFDALTRVDQELASGAPILWDPGRILQGGVADALTHTGQLAMLRRLSGHKMKGENYARAEIAVGRVGVEQSASDPRYEFD